MFRPPYSPWFGHLIIFSKTFKLRAPHYAVFSSFCHFLTLSSQYSPQHSVLKQRKIMFPPLPCPLVWETNFHTKTKQQKKLYFCISSCKFLREETGRQNILNRIVKSIPRIVYLLLISSWMQCWFVTAVPKYLSSCHIPKDLLPLIHHVFVLHADRTYTCFFLNCFSLKSGTQLRISIYVHYSVSALKQYVVIRNTTTRFHSFPPQIFWNKFIVIKIPTPFANYSVQFISLCSKYPKILCMIFHPCLGFPSCFFLELLIQEKFNKFFSQHSLTFVIQLLSLSISQCE